MPLFPAVGRLAALGRLDPARWLAATCALASIVTVGLAASAARLLGGPVAAAIATAFLLLALERHVFARRRWPDPLLGCWTTALFLGLVADWPPLAIGAVLAIAAATRVDALVMLPAAIVSIAVNDVSLSGVITILVVPIVTVAAITVSNGVRYHLWLPDTTFRFNVGLASAEARLMTQSTSERVSAAVRRWDPAQGRLEPVDEATRPKALDFLRGLRRRSVTLIGPDVFVREHLLTAAPSRSATVSLSIAAPTIIVLTVATAGRLTDAYSALLPVAALVITQAAFHTSTRFRHSFLPVLGCLSAVGVVRTIERPDVDFVDLFAFCAGLTTFFVIVGGSLRLQRLRANLNPPEGHPS